MGNELLKRLKPDIASNINLIGSSQGPRLDVKKNKLEAAKTDEALSRLAGTLETTQITEEINQNKLAAQEMLRELEQLNINI